MATQAHVDELSVKHQKLDKDLALEYRRPTLDQARVSELKRRKLKIKDEISRLKTR